ncbi:Deoxyuridine 5'-triphosphate nucleotidohydrolase, partial [Friedmanniomyces endolithicus]
MSSLRHSGNASNAFPHVVRHAFAQGNEYTMDDHATPQPNVTHEIPSLPSSPQPKRTKYTEPAAPHLSVAAILNDAAPTPTPQTTFQPPTMAEPRALPSMPPISLEPPPPTLQVKLLAPSAKAPTRGSAYAAGCDLYASKATVVPARGKVLVDTDISIAVPANTYGRVAPRSG